MSELALPGGEGGGGDLVDAFEQCALAVAASAAAPSTRRAYATAYRMFAAFLRSRYGEASVQTFTVAAAAAWRDHLHAEGLAPSSVAQRVCAVRRLATAIGADPLVAQVRCTQVQHERPKALSDHELSQLLARPDLRTTIGTRDRAILELLARGTETIRARAPDAHRRAGTRPPARRTATRCDRSERAATGIPTSKSLRSHCGPNRRSPDALAYARR